MRPTFWTHVCDFENWDTPLWVKTPLERQLVIDPELASGEGYVAMS
jgi:hypothetical protein